MKKPSPALLLISFGLLVMVYAPIAVIVHNSFRSPESAHEGWLTLKWYTALWKDGTIFSALKNTMVLALTSTSVATVLGTALGMVMARARGRFQSLAISISYVPIVIPDILMAVALLFFFSWCHQVVGIFGLGMKSMILAHITFQIPFVAWIVQAGARTIDPATEQAAQDLGATRTQVFTRITLPLLQPAIMGGALLAFTLSLDDFVISFFTSGPGTMTLPILIYSSVKRGISPEIDALSTVIVTCSALAVILLGRLQQPRQAY
jgi:spermidine/putrescine transport system permease protein